MKNLVIYILDTHSKCYNGTGIYHTHVNKKYKCIQNVQRQKVTLHTS